MKTCPFCNLYKCDHCRCKGYPGCNHEAGRLCSNGRYARHYFCNQCARLMRDFNNKKDVFLGSKNILPTKSKKRVLESFTNPPSITQPNGISPFNPQQFLNPNSFIQSFNPINITPSISLDFSNTRIWVNNDADLFYFNDDVLKGFESVVNKNKEKLSLTVEKEISTVNIIDSDKTNDNSVNSNTSDEKNKENEINKQEKSGFLDELANLALSINNNNNNNNNNSDNSNSLTPFSHNFINLQSNINKPVDIYNNNITISSTLFPQQNPLQQQQQQLLPQVNTIEVNSNNQNNNNSQPTVQKVNFISDIVYETSNLNSISIIQIGEYERNDILYLNVLYNSNPIAVVPYNKEYDLLSYLRAYMKSKLFPKTKYSFIFYSSSGIPILEDNESDFYISSVAVDNQYFNHISNSNITISSICFGIDYKYRVCKRYNSKYVNVKDDNNNIESPTKKQKCDNSNIFNTNVKSTSLPPQLVKEEPLQQSININPFTSSIGGSDGISSSSSSSLSDNTNFSLTPQLPSPPLLSLNNLKSTPIQVVKPESSSPTKTIVSRPTPLSFSLNQNTNLSIQNQTSSINPSILSLGINNQILPLINPQQQQMPLPFNSSLLNPNINLSSIIPQQPPPITQIPIITTNNSEEQDLVNQIQQYDDKYKMDLASDVINHYNGNIEDSLGSLLYHSLYYNDMSSFKKLIIMGVNLDSKINDNNIAYHAVCAGKWNFFSLLLSLFYDNNLLFCGKPNFLLNPNVIEQINGLTVNESMKSIYKQVIERFVYIPKLDNLDQSKTSLVELRKELMKKYDKKFALNQFSFILNGVFIIENQEKDLYCKDILTEKGYLVYINPLIRKHDKTTKQYCSMDVNFLINLQNNWRKAESNQSSDS